MKLTYTVVFILDANGWGAYVPDVPGCVSVGDTWEEMLEMIDEALTGHVEVMLEYGEQVPEPRMSIEDAVAYHSEVAEDDLGDLGLDFGDPPPTLATRFEPVEIEVRVPEPAQSSRAPQSAPVPAL
jgi:predicted RNase H-like HicB family nuclease